MAVPSQLDSIIQHIDGKLFFHSKLLSLCCLCVVSYRKSIQPSIFYTHNPNSGSRGGQSLSQLSLGERLVHPGQVISPSQSHTETNERQPCKLALSRVSLLKCIFFWSFTRITEHANSTKKGSSQDLHQEPSSCEATVLTTTQLCSPLEFLLL